ncbi:MAG: AzlD domain-containing protein [Rhodobiaceae bacterium]|nr:AzlD domain-containing protein [Rhodobiaceae bacterium]
MNVDSVNLIVILAMAVITYLTRLGGVFISRRLAGMDARMRAAFEAIPPVVLIAVVAPSMLTEGVAETAASAIAIVAALRLPLIAVILIGTLAVVLLRLAGL